MSRKDVKHVCRQALLCITYQQEGPCVDSPVSVSDLPTVDLSFTSAIVFTGPLPPEQGEVYKKTHLNNRIIIYTDDTDDTDECTSTSAAVTSNLLLSSCPIIFA